MDRDIVVHCIVMIRNEADIIVQFLSHSLALFDKVWIIDVQSTDGTKELLESVAARSERISLHSCRTQERYQAALMRRFSIEAMNSGAEWVFFLDGDEFVDVPNRGAFRAELTRFPHALMSMPWSNLVPTRYGRFEHFDIAQRFHRAGRSSTHSKIAVNVLHLRQFKDFVVAEGNHAIHNRPGAPPTKGHPGFSLGHLPVRSLARLRYKLENGVRLLRSKHNSTAGEGFHAEAILSFIEKQGSDAETLNTIAVNYGEPDGLANAREDTRGDASLEPFPFLTAEGVDLSGLEARSLAETMNRDARIHWVAPGFAPDSPIQASLGGKEVLFVPQPMTGAGEFVTGDYATLTQETEPPRDVGDRMTEAIEASFLPLDVLRVSGWSALAPALFAAFASLRPRRYVELGVHNGMSFFAACQIAARLTLCGRCIGVDSWVGDAHAGFFDPEVLNNFRAILKEKYPHQHIIHSYFVDALQLFQENSIDLLHIDGRHRYEDVKKEFVSWLPKMSARGVVLLHDIDVHQDDFGVWRLWEEMRTTYVCAEIPHSHGLGLVYVGAPGSQTERLIHELNKNDEFRRTTQLYFQLLGETSVALRRQKDQSEKLLKIAIDLWRSRGRRFNRGELEDEVEIIRASGLFDEEFYLSENPDVRRNGVDPVRHFVEFGALELRNPSRRFDMRKYLMDNIDHIERIKNPLIDHMQSARLETKVARPFRSGGLLSGVARSLRVRS